jgi:hypothetical protein
MTEIISYCSSYSSISSPLSSVVFAVTTEFDFVLATYSNVKSKLRHVKKLDVGKNNDFLIRICRSYVPFSKEGTSMYEAISLSREISSPLV